MGARLSNDNVVNEKNQVRKQYVQYYFFVGGVSNLNTKFVQENTMKGYISRSTVF